jgi:hypothetical protein
MENFQKAENYIRDNICRIFVIDCILEYRQLLSHLPNSRDAGPPLVGSSRVPIQHIRSYSARVFVHWPPRMRHTVVIT